MHAEGKGVRHSPQEVERKEQLYYRLFLPRASALPETFGGYMTQEATHRQEVCDEGRIGVCPAIQRGMNI